MPIAVGLFDRDKAGIKEYGKLGNNFEVVPGVECTRRQRQGTCAAILLPATAGRERHAEVENLELEHYFADAAMLKQIDNKGLRVLAPELTLAVSGIGRVPMPEGQTLNLGNEYSPIDSSSKKAFVEAVLPTLSRDDFAAFEDLFALVESTISDLEQMRATVAGA